MNRNVKILAVQAKLTKMLRRGYFCVCDARKMAELLDVHFSSEEEAFLSTLHCVEFGDMHDEVKTELQSILQRTYSKEAFVIEVGRTLLGSPKHKTLSIADTA